ERSKSDPHAPPGHPDGAPGHSASQHFPLSGPPTHDARQPPSGQSAKVVHAWPSFGPPAQRPLRRAMRRMVYGASEEPNSVKTSALGSACGSKMGGSRPPSGAYDVVKDRAPGGSRMLTGDEARKTPRRSRGTGTFPWRTRTRRQSIGARRFPALS